MGPQLTISAVCVGHLIVAGVHGTTHSLVPVGLPPWLDVIVVAATFVGPLAGVLLVRRGNALGIPLFTVSMAVALAVGGVLHFVLDNPDHIHSIPETPWRGLFRGSAVGVGLTEALGTTTGAWYWLRHDSNETQNERY